MAAGTVAAGWGAGLGAGTVAAGWGAVIPALVAGLLL